MDSQSRSSVSKHKANALNKERLTLSQLRGTGQDIKDEPAMFFH